MIIPSYASAKKKRIWRKGLKFRTITGRFQCFAFSWLSLQMPVQKKKKKKKKKKA